LPGISPSIRCNHMTPIFTDYKEQISYCRECLPESGYKTVLFPNYSPELISYYDEMKIPYKRIPDHNLLCNALDDEAGPMITSLTDGAEYLVFAGRKQQLLFKSNCNNGVKTIYWYVDKKFYKKCSPNESVYFLADKGLHSISCSDDRGRTSSINIKVTLI
ncbi:MAG: penicillin-binding protein 1C, partial [Omnitrophica WOR_2 bacterium]